MCRSSVDVFAVDSVGVTVGEETSSCNAISYSVVVYDFVFPPCGLILLPDIAATAPYPPSCRTKLSNTVIAHVIIDSCDTNSGSLFPIDDDGGIIKSIIRCNIGSLDNDNMNLESNGEFCIIVISISDACWEYDRVVSSSSSLYFRSLVFVFAGALHGMMSYPTG